MATDRRLAIASGPPRTRRPLHVCLVRPPVVTAPKSLSYYGAVPDLGLAYVAAAVRAAGHRVTVIDAPGLALDRMRPWTTHVGELCLQGLALEEIVERVPADAAVVGFAHMFLHEWPLLAELVARVRARRPDVLTVAGGENATAFADIMLDRCRALDVCVCGEGEATVLTLLDAIGSGSPLADVPQLALRDRGSVRRTIAAPRIAALDAWPWPAWDLFPLAAYFAAHAGSGVDRGAAVPVLTSRGCPYTCTFCSAPQMWTTRYVRRDPERVLDEIEHLVETHDVRNVDLHDLTALLTKRWIVEFCRAVLRRDLRFTWQLPSGTRSEAVDGEAARLMVAAGCRNFCYAPESGSPSELERIHKRVEPTRLLGSVRAATKAGLVTHASFIVGLPDQDAVDLGHTLAYLVRLAHAGLHTVSVMVFAPYPGSALYDRLRADGRIVLDDRWFYGSLLRSAGGSRSHHGRWGGRRLFGLQLGLLFAFFTAAFARRPQRIVRTAIDVARGRQRTVLEQLLATKANQLRRLSWLGAALAPWGARVNSIIGSLRGLREAKRTGNFTGIDRTR
jgi:radical SAM superfamily enzyme YgiQ (UPF0313 family)